MVAASAGFAHTCVLTTEGGVKCWGINFEGQLGDGTSTSRATPVDVTSLGSGVAAVEAGSYHTCAFTISGGVKCWGRNSEGQLGDGTATDSVTPVSVLGLTSGIVEVAAGGYHSCALTTAEGVECWGKNSNGQLGDGTSSESTTPVTVSGLTSDIAAIGAGLLHTCALTTTGGIKCWGNNQFGQLGDGRICGSFYNTPVDVLELPSGVAAVAAGSYHTCAITIAGGVKCWGDNRFGELGDGQGCGTFSCSTPVDVTGLSGAATAVSAGGAGGSGSGHTCAVTAAGTLRCWGNNNLGQVGDGTSGGIRSTPVGVVGLTTSIGHVATGDSHTCAVDTTGAIKCWGFGFLGVLGNGRSSPLQEPNPVPQDVVVLEAKPTPTPFNFNGTPVVVGGIAELSEVAGKALETGGSFGSDVGAVAALFAVSAGALALGGTAWYARRRRSG